ncbi:MAG: tRNA-binding protein [Euryarchaeota archaeon]|nr:tRNA-binding protein [Euryarchaeota archaeon]RPG72845.1 MAG: tRNA-binding protein [Euryarchaeota archaeon TMED192]|tara:strand:- start:1031 stop:1426 length:396 start_codon:yes stop_codon:yes gene_type:complete
MSEHVIDSSQPYHPEKLEKKEYVGASAYFDLDLRSGIILKVEEFPEMRKPSYKIEVDFGPVIGKLWSSAQITNYSREELLGRVVVGVLNLGGKTLPTGFVSQFLVLGALDPDGAVRLLELPKEVMIGSMVA